MKIKLYNPFNIKYGESAPDLVLVTSMFTGIGLVAFLVVNFFSIVLPTIILLGIGAVVYAYIKTIKYIFTGNANLPNPFKRKK